MLKIKSKSVGQKAKAFILAARNKYIFIHNTKQRQVTNYSLSILLLTNFWSWLLGHLFSFFTCFIIFPHWFYLNYNLQCYILTIIYNNYVLLYASKDAIPCPPLVSRSFHYYSKFFQPLQFTILLIISYQSSCLNHLATSTSTDHILEFIFIGVNLLHSLVFFIQVSDIICILSFFLLNLFTQHDTI